MNTITFDGGIKRQFVLPAAIVLGAHATLFFGFISNPAMPLLNPPRIHEKEHEQIDLPPLEEVAGRKGDDPAHSRSSPLRLPDVQNPFSPPQPDRPVVIMTPVSTKPDVNLPIMGPWLPDNSTKPGGSPDGQTFSSDLLDHAPHAVAQPQPIYPFAARNTGESGEVVVTFVVDKSGCVLNPRVVRSSDPVFEEPTLRAIQQWRFAPGTWHGVPVRFRMSVPVTFHVNV